MPARNPVLVAINGPLAGARFALDRQIAELGRDPASDVYLPEAAASRRHCRIERRPDGAFVVRDLESLNGTLVNGAAVAERVLAHGDRLEVGDSTFVFLAEPPGPDGEPPPEEARLRLTGCGEGLAVEDERLPGAGAQCHDRPAESPVLERVRGRLAALAPGKGTVLIQGERGTGKELAARALHQGSGRAGGPFVALHCATPSAAQLERELFGEGRDTSSSLTGPPAGKLELADGGTLFLDEIGALAPALQERLLGVLEDGRFDVRIVAATERELATLVTGGRFSSDLYQRLNVETLGLTPLRERPGDILLLAGHFLDELAGPCRRQVRGLAPAARDLLLAYPWPGNVRELRNAIERALVLGSSELIEPEDLPQNLGKGVPAGFGDSTAGR